MKKTFILLAFLLSSGVVAEEGASETFNKLNVSIEEAVKSEMDRAFLDTGLDVSVKIDSIAIDDGVFSDIDARLEDKLESAFRKELSLAGTY